MEEIARLISECVLQGKEVLEEVHRLRAEFQRVRYSFDDEGAAGAESEA